VVVLGTHRSGTSAVARVINLLGVPLCADDDLTPAGDGNIAGHWESRSLTRRNEQLLHLLGAAWDCPPPASPAVAERLLAEVRTAPARAAFTRTYRHDRWVWKDPRLAILLPFWRAALPGTAAAVLVVRHPLEVSRSLQERNHLAPAHGLAIWERYLRHALASCAGLPVLVVGHAGLLCDPRGTVTALRGFLARCDLGPGRATSGAVATIDPALHHAVSGRGSAGLSDQQRRLWQALGRCVGEHPSFSPPDAGPETPGLDAFLAPRREHWGWQPTPRLPRNPALGVVAPYSAEEIGERLRSSAAAPPRSSGR
jgi:hypothetical protein